LTDGTIVPPVKHVVHQLNWWATTVPPVGAPIFGINKNTMDENICRGAHYHMGKGLHSLVSPAKNPYNIPCSVD